MKNVTLIFMILAGTVAGSLFSNLEVVQNVLSKISTIQLMGGLGLTAMLFIWIRFEKQSSGTSYEEFQKQERIKNDMLIGEDFKTYAEFRAYTIKRAEAKYKQESEIELEA